MTPLNTAMMNPKGSTIFAMFFMTFSFLLGVYECLHKTGYHGDLHRHSLRILRGSCRRLDCMPLDCPIYNLVNLTALGAVKNGDVFPSHGLPTVRSVSECRSHVDPTRNRLLCNHLVVVFAEQLSENTHASPSLSPSKGFFVK